jgi:hypothetical protein
VEVLEQRMGRNKGLVFDAALGRVIVLNKQYWIERPDGTLYSNKSYTGVSHRAPGICGFCGVPDSWEPVAGGSTACKSCADDIVGREELLLQPV